MTKVEFYVGADFKADGKPVEGSQTLAERAREYLAARFGGFTRLDGQGGEVGKPTEHTLVYVTAAECKEDAEEAAQFIRALFRQRSVFWFYGTEAHFTNDPDGE